MSKQQWASSELPGLSTQRSAPVAPITLTTDFGTRDGYVGILKGVILGLAPGVPLVDLSHEIGPQDVAEGAFVLYRAYRYFPPGTVHLAVVDPGVGSARRPLLLCTAHGDFVGPDNGLFSYVLDAERRVAAYHLDVAAFWRPAVSHTFHGRDIFAPCAAQRARGVPAGHLGSPLASAALVRLPPLGAVRTGEQVTGRIVHVDHFGNATVDIPTALLAALGVPGDVICTAGGQPLAGVQTTYAAVAPGAPLALIGSAGLLEIAVRDGDAARMLGLRAGDPVVCRRVAATPPSSW